MDYTKSIVLDVNAVDNYRFIQAKQGDKVLRKLAISLQKDGQPFNPPDVAKSEFRCAKPDGNAVIINSTDEGDPITVSEGVYTVSLSEQVLVVAGRAICDFALYDSNNDILSTATFVLDIIPMPNIGSIIESSTEWARLMHAIETAEDIVGATIQFRVEDEELQYSSDTGETWHSIYQFEVITNAQIDALF